MHTQEISLETFKVEIDGATQCCIDLNSLINACGASPVKIRFKTDKIAVVTEYPERIVLKSGESLISVNQITQITCTESDGRKVYTVSCGYIDELKTIVKIYRA